MLKEIQDGVRTVGQELALCPVLDLVDDIASAAEPRRDNGSEQLVGQRFRLAMGGFHEEMQQRLASLTAQQDETKGLLRKLAIFFGEDPNQTNPDAILRSCAEMSRTMAAADATVAKAAQLQ